MRYVVGTPEEHSIFGNNNNNDDDAVVTMATSPVRRGSSWLIAMVTQRMRFLVFSTERLSSWSRRIVGQLPVATGAVTEVNNNNTSHSSLNNNTPINFLHQHQNDSSSHNNNAQENNNKTKNQFNQCLKNNKER